MYITKRRRKRNRKRRKDGKEVLEEVGEEIKVRRIRRKGAVSEISSVDKFLVTVGSLGSGTRRGRRHNIEGMADSSRLTATTTPTLPPEPPVII